MQRRPIPTWLTDARLWVTVFIVLFWPVVIFTHLVGAIVLLVVVFGAWYALQSVARRAGDRAAGN